MSVAACVLGSWFLALHLLLFISFWMEWYLHVDVPQHVGLDRRVIKLCLATLLVVIGEFAIPVSYS